MSKENKEPMSLSKKYNIRYTIDGLAWLLYAVVNLIPGDGIPLKVVCIILLLIAVICSVVSLVAKSDTEDEMSDLHINKAKAMTLDYTISAFLIFGIISIFLGHLEIDIRKLYPFVIGVVQLLTGVLFWLEERTSDMAILKTKLHELRKERNMQQAELATLVGVRRETIGNLENGKYNPSLKLAMDIAKVFDRTVEEIFFFEEEED